MSKFISVKKLKKEPLISSCDIACAQHCAMDIVLEEVFGLSDLNLLVIGAGECAYYSQKQNFGGNRRNWAFCLSDKEIVFGDLSDVQTAINEISTNGLKTVCVVTCIPSIMNLDVESITNDNNQIIVVKAPDFKGMSSYDILEELYFQILKDAVIENSDGISYWDRDFENVSDLMCNLNAGTYIVRNRKYLKALKFLQSKFDINVIDETTINDLRFYLDNKKILRLSDDAILTITTGANKLSGKKINIKCATAYELALFLQKCGCAIGTIIFSVYNQYAYDCCMKLSSEVLVSQKYGVELPENGCLNIDLSKYDDEILQFQGAKRLCKLFEKLEELCLL